MTTVESLKEIFKKTMPGEVKERKEILRLTLTLTACVFGLNVFM